MQFCWSYLEIASSNEANKKNNKLIETDAQKDHETCLFSWRGYGLNFYWNVKLNTNMSYKRADGHYRNNIYSREQKAIEY